MLLHSSISCPTLYQDLLYGFVRRTHAVLAALWTIIAFGVGVECCPVHPVELYAQEVSQGLPPEVSRALSTSGGISRIPSYAGMLNAAFLYQMPPDSTTFQELMQAFLGDGKSGKDNSHTCLAGRCSHWYQAASAFKSKRESSTQALVLRRPYDVLRYDLMMDWTRPLRATVNTGDVRHYTGVNRITLHVDSAAMNELVLHALELRIDSVRINGLRLRSPVIARARSEEVAIPLTELPRIPQRGDTVIAEVFYTHQSLTNTREGGGFLLYNKGMFGGMMNRTDSAFVAERLAYTMSQPNDARRWMPCNDVPSDKALSSIALKVPLGFEATANGLLQATDTIHTPDGTELVFRWRHDYPVAPYLMKAVASVFQRRVRWYKRVSNPRDSVMVDDYYWAVDDTVRVATFPRYSVRHAFSSVISTLEAYSRWFGEYPFERYGQVVVQPFWAGGMEHQTLSSINRSWLRGTGTQWGVAHEIAHHWIGNSVTCASWSDLWLNEGGATHAEALWYESWGGTPWYRHAMEGFRAAYLRAKPTQSVYIQGGDTLNDINVLFNYATTYCKAGWVYHMMRRLVGDSAYFAAIRHHLNRFAYSVATTEDFRVSLEQHIPNPPVPFRTIFDQWVYGVGHPVYDLTWTARHIDGSAAATRFEATCTLMQRQTGKNVPNVFTMPVALTFVGRDSTERAVRRFFNNQRSQTERFMLPFMPRHVIVDEEGSILAEYTNRAVARQVADSLLTFSLVAYPQPLPQGEALTLELSLSEPSAVTLEMFNALGERVDTLVLNEQAKGTRYLTWSRASTLAAGFYAVRATSATETRVIKVMITK